MISCCTCRFDTDRNGSISRKELQVATEAFVQAQSEDTSLQLADAVLVDAEPADAWRLTADQRSMVRYDEAKREAEDCRTSWNQLQTERDQNALK